MLLDACTRLFLCGLFFLRIRATWAHVTIQAESPVAANEYVKYDFRIPHGCMGDSTNRFEIGLPQGVLSATPESVPGWEATVETRELSGDEQYVSHGSVVTTAPSKIIYEAESTEDHLEGDQYLDFGVVMRLSCDISDEERATMWTGRPTLWFPIVQQCVAGGVNEWVGIGKADEEWALLEPSPSPYVHVESWESCLNSEPKSFKFAGSSLDADMQGPSSVSASVDYVQEQIDAIYENLNAKIAELESRVAQCSCS